MLNYSASKDGLIFLIRVLERKYSYDQSGQHAEDNGSENMIIRGDNLEGLKALLPRHEVRVKCIYIDPPYNTGNGGLGVQRQRQRSQNQKMARTVVGKEGEDLSRHDKWLCMMYPRVKLLQSCWRRISAPSPVLASPPMLSSTWTRPTAKTGSLS